MKDPAFLFYPNDWLGGTLGFSFEEKGALMELLVLQFNVEKFTQAQAKHVLGICSDKVWEKLKQKFKTDGEFYWNERLKLEIEKRKNFANSRRNNALSKKNKFFLNKHMENENRNENENKNGSKEKGDRGKNEPKLTQVKIL